ncbi:MAG: hypothetical protein M3O46_15220 [Myxococcota bacterium]|nr:hypothetical protein [Myxococcota bacterium]
MKRLGWSAAFVITGWMVIANPGCTVVVDNGPPPATDSGDGASSVTTDGSGSGSGSSGGSSGGDTGTRPDAGNQPDASPSVDSGMCPVGIDTSVAACDQCIETMCCAQWVTCTTPDDAGVDDAGRSQCVQLVECALAWAASDAGTVSDGETVCGSSYTQSERDTAHAFLTCKQGPCATQCP